jgi:hypothetical protein
LSSAPLIPSSLFKDARGGAAQPRAGRLQQSGAELLPLKPAAASKIYVRFALSRDRLLSLLHLDFEFLLDTATSPRPTCITRDLLSSCRTCARAVTTPRSTKAGTSDLRRTSSRRFSEPRRALRAYPYASRESPDPGRLRRLSQRLNERVLTSHSSRISSFQTRFPVPLPECETLASLPIQPWHDDSTQQRTTMQTCHLSLVHPRPRCLQIAGRRSATPQQGSTPPTPRPRSARRPC